MDLCWCNCCTVSGLTLIEGLVWCLLRLFIITVCMKTSQWHVFIWSCELYERFLLGIKSWGRAAMECSGGASGSKLESWLSSSCGLRENLLLKHLMGMEKKHTNASIKCLVKTEKMTVFLGWILPFVSVVPFMEGNFLASSQSAPAGRWCHSKSMRCDMLGQQEGGITDNCQRACTLQPPPKILSIEVEENSDNKNTQHCFLRFSFLFEKPKSAVASTAIS